jgi:hypothetical protein
MNIFKAKNKPNKEVFKIPRAPETESLPAGQAGKPAQGNF